MTRARMMPPWVADNRGTCRTWRDALWLSDAELGKLVGWAEQGAPEGDPSRRADSRVPNHAPAEKPRDLERVDAVLDTGADYTPGLGASAYRCFVADPGLTHERMLTGIRVVSTDPRAVAHIAIYGLDSDAAERQAVGRDTEEAGPGYTCYGSPRVEPARLLASWTWDNPTLHFPEGTGLRVSSNRKWVVQILYNVITTGLSTQTRTHIDLKFDDGVRAASFIALRASDMALPPGKNYAEASAHFRADAPMTVLGIAPRMHGLGKTMQIDRTRKDGDECAASFDHWNVYGQRLFIYQEPLRLSTGDELRATCVYNTKTASETVHGGDDITDEACEANLYVVSP
ncbi:hypothetical protein LZC95_34840 [Pendulispora brunnea]|uniref:Copper type II ascorbate-dependent monooxygenase C-terminal domain-containing protein n=1 Tax=Pendulispora brunnea TaxID=2905690 RepID=A0ABZ2K3A8_9BACT